MPSREHGFVWAAIALAVTGVLFAALAAWTLVARSTIPAELDGTVTGIELRHEKHPGVDDVWMISVDDGDLRHVDTHVADLVDVGDAVEKSAWDTSLLVNGEPRPLSLSDDARAMLLLAPIIAVVVVSLTCATHVLSRPGRVDRTA
ncbi:hypothetical protein [Nocardioides sp. SR21]|uniref:hypothetical protein n=1 Tax=Nocardioides sp. SR21 TaxID=2919501 RepID=UPI001FAAC3A7|nr:hypothetical protein [Nocardioides sp. SR21]